MARGEQRRVPRRSEVLPTPPLPVTKSSLRSRRSTTTSATAPILSRRSRSCGRRSKRRSRCRRSWPTARRCRGRGGRSARARASSSASAAATSDLSFSRSVSSPSSTLISRGAWVTPIRMSTAGHSIGAVIACPDRAPRATAGGSAVAHPRVTRPEIIPFSAVGSASALPMCPITTTSRIEEDPVVHERGTRPPRERERLEPPHDRSGREHHRDRAGDERGVELLARVELAHPALAVPVTSAMPSPRSSSRPSRFASALKRRAEQQTEHHRDGQREAAVHVDRLDRLAAADQRRQRAEVQGRRRSRAARGRASRWSSGPTRSDAVEPRDGRRTRQLVRSS